MARHCAIAPAIIRCARLRFAAAEKGPDGMSRYWPWSLFVGSALALSGCVAGIAASAVGMAVKGAQGEPQSNEQLRPAAAQACSAHAAQYGTVHIIDVEQRTTNRIVVWGTVTEGQERRSFQCTYRTKIVDFKLRAIKQHGGAGR